jgi:DNA-binding transcriptional ArsR family regulator
MSLRMYEAVMKAVADPTRVRILKMLEGGELCVCQIIAVLALSPSTISKHLFLLKSAGLVNDRKEKKWVHYSLDRESDDRTWASCGASGCARSVIVGPRAPPWRGRTWAPARILCRTDEDCSPDRGSRFPGARPGGWPRSPRRILNEVGDAADRGSGPATRLGSPTVLVNGRIGEGPQPARLTRINRLPLAWMLGAAILRALRPGSSSSVNSARPARRGASLAPRGGRCRRDAPLSAAGDRSLRADRSRAPLQSRR